MANTFSYDLNYEFPFQTIIRNLWLNEDIKQSIDARKGIYSFL